MLLRREITPRQTIKGGVPVWYIRVPKDLRSPDEPKRRFFGDDKKAASGFARSLRDARVSCGADFLKLPSMTQAAILNGVAAIGSENLIKAINHFKSVQPLHERSIAALVKQCLDEKEQAGGRKGSIKTLKSSLGKFSSFMTAIKGRNRIHEVTTEDCNEWVYSNDLAPKTRRNYMKDGITFFKYCIAHQFAKRDPFSAVQLPKVDQKNRCVLHVSHVEILLEVCQKHDPGLLGYWCPDLFGGLRPNESQRTTKEDVAHGMIDLDGSKTKKRRCRTVVMNDALKAWLAVDGVEFSHTNLVKRCRRIRELAGTALSQKLGKETQFPWEHDIIRHTFCSNAVHKFGFKETSMLACTSEDNLRTTYFSRIKDPKEVEAFWALRPKDDKTIKN